MNIFSVAGITATIVLLVPIVLLITMKLSLYRSFPALLFYYIIVFTDSLLIQNIIPASKEFRIFFGNFCNFMDGPLILIFLTYFSRTAAFRKKLLMLTGCFIVFEIIIIAIYGFNTNSTVIILGVDMVLVIGLAVLFFIQQVKLAVSNYKAIGKAIIIASVLFAYFGYCFIYFAFYVFETSYINDVHLILYIINIISASAISVGIVVEQKRVRQLTELLTVRKELKEIYAKEEPGSNSSAIEKMIFKFDQNT